MNKRRLGNTDLDITRIGLGTWAIGGAWFMGWGEQVDDDSESVIHEALNCGINWIDTAPIYGFGKAERVIAQALKSVEKSKRPLIATKCGIAFDDQKRAKHTLRRASIEREAEDSLKRLQCEVIDLYQIHWPDPEEEIEEGFDALLRLQQRGLIRWPAVSNFSVEQLELVSKVGEVASLQPPYNLLKPEIEDELLPWCNENNLGVVTYSPMECGVLSGKFSKEWVENLKHGDWRKRKKAWKSMGSEHYIEEPRYSALLEFLDSLETTICRKRELPLSQLAIAWVLRREEVTAAIVGARKPRQITETAGASDFNLTSGEIDLIEESYQKYLSTSKA